jgi:integrase
MARRVKDATLESREARGKLKARGKPHWRAIERGVHLGYRRLRGRAGTWCVRHYVGDQAYEVEGIGTADDLSDADGVAILDFWQAQVTARQRMVERAHTAAGRRGPYTVAQAMTDYLHWLADKGKSAKDSEYRANAFILPHLGKIEIAKLTTDQLHEWHVGLSKQAPRLRTVSGAKQQYRKREKDVDADEWRRQRRASANRTLTILKAALNRAWRDGKVASNTAWARVEPFEAVEAARIRYLSVAEAQRLINTADADFRLLVQAALQTGCRYSELGRLIVNNYNSDAGTLHVRQSKSGKGRHVVLTDEGRAFFKALCASRTGSEIMLTKESGEAWQKSHQNRPMAAACERAKIRPPISFHGLRHTWASLAAMNGVPLLVVAKNLGHADTRMVEKHYGHLAPSYIADAIRAGAPRFGFKPDRKVAPIDDRGR